MFSIAPKHEPDASARPSRIGIGAAANGARPALNHEQQVSNGLLDKKLSNDAGTAAASRGADRMLRYALGLVALVAATGLARISQCAQTARITSGGRFHPESCRFGLVAGKRPGWVTGPVEALRQRPPWAVERSSGP
jgi:hypothetical protein